LLITTPCAAYAYIDPGTGSYLFQIAGAGLLSALFFTKTIFRSVKVFFSKCLSKKPGEKNRIK
jgi:hypothetical protein